MLWLQFFVASVLQNLRRSVKLYSRATFHFGFRAMAVSRSTKTYFSRILYTGNGPEIRSRYLRIKESHRSWGSLIFEYFISEYASATTTSSSFEVDGKKMRKREFYRFFYYQSEGNMYFLWNSILSVSLVRSISWSFGTMNLIPFCSAWRFGIFFGRPSRAKSVQVFIIRSDNSFSSCVQYFPCVNELSKTNISAVFSSFAWSEGLRPDYEIITNL